MKSSIVTDLSNQILEVMTDFYPHTLYGVPKEVTETDVRFKKAISQMIHEAVEADAKGYYYV